MKIPHTLYVSRLNANRLEVFKFIQTLAKNKYLYESVDYGYKEVFTKYDLGCFLTNDLKERLEDSEDD